MLSAWSLKKMIFMWAYPKIYSLVYTGIRYEWEQNTIRSCFRPPFVFTIYGSHPNVILLSQQFNFFNFLSYQTREFWSQSRTAFTDCSIGSPAARYEPRDCPVYTAVESDICWPSHSYLH